MEKLRLDFILEGEENQFARKSYKAFLASLALYILSTVIFIGSGVKIRKNEILSILIGLMIVAGFIIAIIGLVNGIKSYKKKEPQNHMKYIGLIGNAVLILPILRSIVNARGYWVE